MPIPTCASASTSAGPRSTRNISGCRSSVRSLRIRRGRPNRLRWTGGCGSRGGCGGDHCRHVGLSRCHISSVSRRVRRSVHDRTGHGAQPELAGRPDGYGHRRAGVGRGDGGRGRRPDPVVSESVLQLVIGTLLLVFGLQWLRKAILRAGGFAALHDERAAFRAEQEAARVAGHQVRLGLDWMAFIVSFKGVFLEGLEVVFIVITFGLSATRYNPHGLLVASGSAVLAGLLVVVVGVIARRPLSAVPENTMKYAAGLLLT